MEKSKRLPAFSGVWQTDNNEPKVIPIGGYLPFRKWQSESFRQLEKKKLRIVNAPTASGKSLLMMALAKRDCELDPKLSKIVIAVPQNAIGEGYNDRFRYIFNGKKHSIRPSSVLCGSSGNTAKLKRFLSEKKMPNADDHVIICTHSTLRRLYQSCKAKERKKLFKNTALWIDESHHVMCQKVEYEAGGEIATEMNKLGTVVNYFLKSDLSVGLATATFFRSDGNGLILPEFKKSFERYSLGFDKYIEECSHLRSFSYDFLFYKDNYFKAITELFQEKPSEKTIIYLPYVNSSYSFGGHKKKAEEVQKIIQAISPRAKPRYVKNGGCPYYEVVLKGKILRVFDLVKERGRNKRVKYIKDEFEKSQEEKREPVVDVIVTLGVYKEGANYPPLSRVIVAGTRGSSVELIQVIGRGVRDYPGKSHAYIYQLLRDDTAMNYPDNEAFRRDFNNYLKSILISMLMEDEFFPHVIKKKQEQTSKKLKVSSGHCNLWMETFGKDNYIAVKHDILMELISNISDDCSIEERWERFERAADARLTPDVPDPDVRRKMIDHLKMTMARRTLRLRGEIDLDDIDINLLDDIDPLGWLFEFTSKAFGVATFSQLRKKIYADDATDTEWLSRLAKWWEKNNIKPDHKAKNIKERRLGEFIARLEKREVVQFYVKEWEVKK